MAVLRLFGLIAVIGILSGIDTAYAQGVGTAPTQSMLTTVANGAGMIATVMQFLAFLSFHFLQYLLDPLFIIGITQDNANGQNMLLEIWQFSRNVMNIIFAFLLITGGIVTVVTHSSEIFSQYFKKFIIAVILVNFSWFFPRVILDVANVLTATIYQLPSQVGSTCTYYVNDVPQPCTIITDIKYANQCNPVPAGYKSMGPFCFKEAPFSPNTNTALGMLNGLVVNYGRLKDITRVIKPAGPLAAGPGANANIMMFLIHVVFIMALTIMLTLPLISMVIIFTIRIPVIWLTIAFMPFMFLGFVIGDKMGSFNTMKIFENFVKAAFLPAVVAIPISIGFIMLSAMYGTTAPDVASQLNNKTGSFVYGIEKPWQLLWLITTLLVIWKGFFMGVEGMGGIYSEAVKGIKGLGESVGGTVAKLPLSIPFIPTGNGGSMSILGVDDKIRQFGASLSSGQGPGTAFSNTFGSGAGSGSSTAQSINKAFNDPSSQSNKLLADIERDLKAKATADGGTLRQSVELELTNQLNAGGGAQLAKARAELAADGVQNASTLTAQQIAQALKDKFNTDGTKKP